MCGLGGYAGIGSEVFARALGIELDMRGGHAAGYVNDKGWATRVGPWESARRRFVRRAGEGAAGIIHARYATCGTQSQRDAHPFEIRRGGAPVLYGAHNGMIDDADDCAKEYGRPYTVDSRELFELIADGEFPTIQNLAGYGVASWMVPGKAEVNLSRLTESGEICVVSISGGGYAWASTWEILASALVAARLIPVDSYKLEVGTVYKIRPDGIFTTSEKRCSLSTRMRSWLPSSWKGCLNDDELDEIFDAQKDDLFEMDGRDDDPWKDNEDDTDGKWSKWADVGRCGS
jgi:hypothetical protein